MAAADVENLFQLLSAHCYPTEPWLSQGLAAALAEEVITQIRRLSVEKRGLLRDMRRAVEGGAANLTLAELQTLNARVADAGQGPLYFNLVVMVYPVWSKDYRAFLSSVGSLPSTPESMQESSDEDLRSMRTAPHAGTRRTGGVRPARSVESMSVLLAALDMCATEP